jgi:hypothetical protein
MNYIKRLQAENDEALRRLREIQDICQQYRAELLSPKFTGVDLDGSRKDYMGTTDIDLRLQNIHSLAMNG